MKKNKKTPKQTTTTKETPGKSVDLFPSPDFPKLFAATSSVSSRREVAACVGGGRVDLHYSWRAYMWENL